MNHKVTVLDKGADKALDTTAALLAAQAHIDEALRLMRVHNAQVEQQQRQQRKAVAV